jgi:hypothetical protein
VELCSLLKRPVACFHAGGTGFSRDMWPGLKASGKCPFGQLPLLEVDGRNVGQCVAVVNTIGSKAGTGGRNTADFITSQMLLGEAEDLYAGMQKYCPTVFAKLGERMKGGAEQYADWWARGAPTHMGKLEKLLAKSSSWPCRFTAGKTSGWVLFCVRVAEGFAAVRLWAGGWCSRADGKSVGELYLWSMLHQMVLVRSGALLFKSTPNLRAFYENTAALPGVANVVDGSSSFGPLKQ